MAISTSRIGTPSVASTRATSEERASPLRPAPGRATTVTPAPPLLPATAADKYQPASRPLPVTSPVAPPGPECTRFTRALLGLAAVILCQPPHWMIRERRGGPAPERRADNRGSH